MSTKAQSTQKKGGLHAGVPSRHLALTRGLDFSRDLGDPQRADSALQPPRGTPHFHHDFGELLVTSAEGSRPPPIQAKLTIGQPGDKYEQEADRIADEVMRLPEPQVQQRKPTPGDGTPPAQREAHFGADELGEARLSQGGYTRIPRVTTDVDIPLAKLRSEGRALPGSERDFFERRLGFSLGHIRIHEGETAQAAAASVGARAFTIKNHIVFNRGEFRPGSTRGRHLLGHEIAHVCQQSAGVRCGIIQRETELSQFYWRPKGNKEDLTPVPGPAGPILLPSGGFNRVPLIVRTRSEWVKFLENSVGFQGTGTNLLRLLTLSPTDADQLALFMAVATQAPPTALTPALDLGPIRVQSEIEYYFDPSSPTPEIRSDQALELMRAFADISGKTKELDVPEVGTLDVNGLFHRFVKVFWPLLVRQELRAPKLDVYRTIGVANAFADVGGDVQSSMLHEALDVTVDAIPLAFRESQRERDRALQRLWNAGSLVRVLIDATHRMLANKWEPTTAEKIVAALFGELLGWAFKIPFAGEVVSLIQTAIRAARSDLSLSQFLEKDRTLLFIQNEFKKLVMDNVQLAIEGAAAQANEDPIEAKAAFSSGGSGMSWRPVRKSR